MNEWQERDKNSVWHPFTPLMGVAEPLMITRAEGPYLFTNDGRRILDAISSWWVNLHGHSHPHIQQAIARQAGELEHVIFAGFTHKPAIELAESLLKILPGPFERIFYSDNGSTAVEVALKLAFQYWENRGEPRRRVIALDGAYHGDTFGAMSVGERSIFTKPFFPYLFDVEFIPLPDGQNDSEVITQFERLISDGEVASFIFEPLVQGAAGMRMYSAKTLDRLLEIAKSHEIICIADEVMTGFGRTGRLFACEFLAHSPDLICLSKGLTGGALPLGATACTAEIMRPYLTADLRQAFLHGHSYTANPMACAAANASLELLLTDDCLENIKRIAQSHSDFVRKHAGNDRLKDIRSMGTILALEFYTDQDSSYVSEMRNSLYPFFLERNILLRPLGNLIYVLPPYVTSDKDLEAVYTAIEAYLSL
ncbi:adenosylmethionine--8-amino-7-oxononanoate transaminase [Fulvivirga sedimenti]|uniref:Adenosylmethionine-8-amino-7-oxononanoate aminotransferase n=1 Tax=Fulvivirga sedimenti TaxID=2879465 RepID=A0A9X1KZN6_9BACT|nr:adenosylmethionine--8-amino-7-oxononanoate transaminase [Fulvivirga sedimenti]MCA6079068.1 adenosylmethionine--8-amino-7-oxononanoate transaminase [Fulvivirga sedimenti]